MKKFNILIVLLLFSFTIFGQDRFPQLRTKLNRVFARVDKTQIPTGILEEYSFGFMNLWQINTGANLPMDSTHAINSTVWRSTYATLETGKINPTIAGEYAALPPLDSVNQWVKNTLA